MGKQLLWTMLDQEFIEQWRSNFDVLGQEVGRDTQTALLPPMAAIGVALVALRKTMLEREKQDLAGGGSQ